MSLSLESISLTGQPSIVVPPAAQSEAAPSAFVLSSRYAASPDSLEGIRFYIVPAPTDLAPTDSKPPSFEDSMRDPVIATSETLGQISRPVFAAPMGGSIFMPTPSLINSPGPGPMTFMEQPLSPVPLPPGARFIQPDGRSEAPLVPYLETNPNGFVADLPAGPVSQDLDAMPSQREPASTPGQVMFSSETGSITYLQQPTAVGFPPGYILQDRATGTMPVRRDISYPCCFSKDCRQRVSVCCFQTFDACCCCLRGTADVAIYEVEQAAYATEWERARAHHNRIWQAQAAYQMGFRGPYNPRAVDAYARCQLNCFTGACDKLGQCISGCPGCLASSGKCIGSGCIDCCSRIGPCLSSTVSVCGSLCSVIGSLAKGCFECLGNCCESNSACCQLIGCLGGCIGDCCNEKGFCCVILKCIDDCTKKR
jgi:hypothetical protein